jgi:hypothetical protein
MPVIRGNETNHAQSIAKLKDAGGFDAAVQLGEQALAALNTANVGGKVRTDAQEILQAVTLLASHLDGVTVPGQLNVNDPKSVVAHLAQGGSIDKPLTPAQIKGLEAHLEASIKAGTDLPQIAEAAKNMTYGNPSQDSPGGLSYAGGNYGSGLKETVRDWFEEHQPQASKDLGVDAMQGGLQAM